MTLVFTPVMHGLSVGRKWKRTLHLNKTTRTFPSIAGILADSSTTTERNSSSRTTGEMCVGGETCVGGEMSVGGEMCVWGEMCV